jgi:hypothetical protein
VGIGSDKSILNRVLRVSCIAEQAICPSVERREPISQNLFQLSSCSRSTWNFIAFVTPDVCISVLHALFLNPSKVLATRVSIASLFPNLKLSPLNPLLVSPDSYWRAELDLSTGAS